MFSKYKVRRLRYNTNTNKKKKKKEENLYKWTINTKSIVYNWDSTTKNIKIKIIKKELRKLLLFFFLWFSDIFVYS